MICWWYIHWYPDTVHPCDRYRGICGRSSAPCAIYTVIIVVCTIVNVIQRFYVVGTVAFFYGDFPLISWRVYSFGNLFRRFPTDLATGLFLLAIFYGDLHLLSLGDSYFGDLLWHFTPGVRVGGWFTLMTPVLYNKTSYCIRYHTRYRLFSPMTAGGFAISAALLRRRQLIFRPMIPFDAYSD